MEEKLVWDFTDDEKQLITSLTAKGRSEQVKNDKFAIIDFTSFYELFTDEEVAIMKKWLVINPKDIDYKLPFLGAKDSPSDVVAIAGQTYVVDGQTQTIPCQYLPSSVYGAYLRLNAAMQEDIDKDLLVLFGHRSPARQVFIFFDILERIYAFDFNKTIQRVCFPDYSEHVCTQRQAIDFKTRDELASDAFATTAEYAWLQRHAQQFGFYESYPKNNGLGMMYEPWHWHYEPLTP
jgi:hypothetical protein